MDIDPVLLARIQFAFVALYHYLFVPLSVGFGLIVSILHTKAFRSGDDHDIALARFWTRLFAVTFALGVATGITEEFSFGTNWADYSRFVGDIFGAPLAAEALFAFFMESVFLGILLFGEKKVGKKLLLASAWLVWIGSCLSALWIIIANSWMQTPAGYEVVDTGTTTKAVLTSFVEAAFNPSTLQRYGHVIFALLVTGSLTAIAIGAYYLLKKREEDAGKKLIRIGTIAGIICACGLMVAAHQQAVEVAEEQPAKLAAMEGQWESGPVDMSLVGWIDESTQTTHALNIPIPGLTSFLATFDFSAEFPGLNDYSADERPTSINAIYISYHVMVALIGIIAIVLIIALFATFRRGGIKNKWLLRILCIGPFVAMAAIECGWLVAELGRQPYIVYGELKIQEAASNSVDALQMIITLVLFLLVYVILYAAWIRSFAKTLKAGPSSFMPENAANATLVANGEASSSEAAQSGVSVDDAVKADDLEVWE